MKLTPFVLAIASTLGADSGRATPLTRDQVVGEIEIPTTGASETVRLCRNGTYVRPIVCGGFVRGTWKLADGGVDLRTKEVCLVLGVAGTEAGGATAECVYYKRYRFLGCVAPERAKELAKGSPNGLPVLEDGTIDAASFAAMFAGKPPPGEESLEWAWKHRRTPEPRACERGWRPRSVRDARDGIR